MANEVTAAGLYGLLNPGYQAPNNSKVKESFLDIYTEMYGVVEQMADPNEAGITVKGRYFEDKTNIAALTAVNYYTDELSQRGQLLLKMLEFENKFAQSAGQAAAK